VIIPGVIELYEDPLCPFEVFRVSGIYLAVPVVAQAQFLYLAAEGVAVFVCGYSRVGSGLDGVLFGRQAEGIPSHGMEYVEALHAFVPCHDVSGGVALWMAHVQAGAGRVGVHVKDIVFIWI